MSRLQAHRHFQPAGEQITERQASFIDERRMALDNHPLEIPKAFRNPWMIRDGNRPGVKETATVVELDLTRCGKASQGEIDLVGDRPHRNGVGQGVFPKVAHQASPGTLPVRQEKRGHRDDLAELGALPLREERERLLRIDWVPGRTVRENPLIPFAWLIWVGESQSTGGMPLVGCAGALPEGPCGFEPFIVSSLRRCRRSPTDLSSGAYK